MGTREVYEEKLRRGNLHHDPTIKPGLGSARCPRCLSLLNPIKESSEWEITQVLHDATSVKTTCFWYFAWFIVFREARLRYKGKEGQHLYKQAAHDATEAGSGIGGFLSAVHSFNTGIPHLQNRVKGPKWLPFVIGLPPLLMFSAVSAAFGGYALPKFTQVTVTSYYAVSSASHHGVSLLTRYIEDNHVSRIQNKQLR